ncbi:hypothetical protein [Flavobacterium aciduliphilum]|uniref:D-alanine transfer protein n=1 Tax=Flavobacterium aciduliphilum TaxID=1101402 RepID=A0A328Y6B6_9FLAO|nr:hypothetical protein [Flavobacterium aciduliphilum]RAR69304.1 hypothetical protein CLV55_11625 [Flavobacterium aciduliphilum]
MKFFLIRLIVSVIPAVLVIVLVNYYGDFANIFNKGYEKKIAKIILNDKYVTNISNFEDRLLQREIIGNMKFTPDIIVLGSSRTMLINSQYFPNKKIFNNSVFGASIEDIIAIYQIYKEKHKYPKKVIIGIDPWYFNTNNDQKRWESIGEYYKSFVNNQKNTIESSEWKNNKQLISLSYFQCSLKNLIKKIRSKSNIKETVNKYNKTNTKLNDGSITYGVKYRSANQKIVNDKIKDYLSGQVYSIEKFNYISDKYWHDFMKLIFDLKRNKIQIEFFLSPYAPLVYDTIKVKYINVCNVEKRIVKFAIKNNIDLYGSFNPYTLKMDEAFFYDGMHCKEIGINRIFNNFKIN